MSNPLTDRVATLLGMYSGRAFARGSTGLYALLRALALRDGPGEVVIPTLCCETVAMAAVFAEHEVRFADVSPVSLCCTPETVAPLMSSRTRAVLVVHLYGIDAHVDTFRSLRAQFPKAVFIEDVAHALGGHAENGRLLGGGLDCTLASFAPSKILPGDGGMLLWHSKTLQPGELDEWVDPDAARVDGARLALSLRNLVHAIADLWREGTARPPSPVFPGLVAHYERLVVSPGGIGDTQAVSDGLDRLDRVRRTRYEKYRRYADGIESHSVTIPVLHEGSTCWRCPLVFESAAHADTATARLRADGIPASNHYFPLSVLFGATPCPQGESVARRIVNLWVDENLSDELLQHTIEIINLY